MSPRLSVLDFNGFSQFRMIAILLVVYQGMVRLGENGRNGEIGCMVGSYMCIICITWKCVEGYEVSRSAWWNRHHWSSQPCDLFWNSDVTWTSTMDFPSVFFPLIFWSTYHEKHVTLLSLLNFPQGCWDGNPLSFFMSVIATSSRTCVTWALEQATPCENIFVPVQLPRSWRRKVWTKVFTNQRPQATNVTPSWVIQKEVRGGRFIQHPIPTKHGPEMR